MSLYDTPGNVFPNYDGNSLLVIAGPCAVESREGLLRKANQLADLMGQGYPIHCLRGGAFKPRTRPDSFQGLGEEALKYLVEARKLTGLPIDTEIMDPRQVPMFKEYGIDIWHVGSRNMQNFPLLKEVGENRGETPVLLKRGMCTRPEEILGAIEYLRDTGPILLCLRGLQKMDYGDTEITRLMNKRPHQHPNLRFYSDVDDIEPLKDQLSSMGHVIVGFDPSHVSGNHVYVPRISIEAVEHGADFLIVEIIENEEERPQRRCDGQQALTIEQLKPVLKECQSIYRNRQRV